MDFSKPNYIDLRDAERFLDFPYRLSGIGWMPHHIHIHRDEVLEDLFFCISSALEQTSISVVNGKLQKHAPHPLVSMSVVLPGTRIKTLRASYHDELFFKYPASAEPLFRRLFGEELLVRGCRIFAVPQEEIERLRSLLSRRNVPGTADLLDQQAVHLFTVILLGGMREEPDGRLELRLNGVAAELQKGTPKDAVLRQFGFSERTFYREWARGFRQSPGAYIRKNRCMMAARLLEEGELSLCEISQRCGFSCQGSFYRSFLQEFGVAPGRYRRRAITEKCIEYR